MEGHAEKCVVRYCEPGEKKKDRAGRTGIGWRSVKNSHNLSPNACILHELVDVLRSVNKLARAITQRTRACKKRLARLISQIHHTSDYRQYCHVGNTAQHCWMGLLQHSVLLETLKTPSQLREESFASSEVDHSSPLVGWARSKHQYLTVLQKLK